jgi:hypothetical protein
VQATQVPIVHGWWPTPETPLGQPGSGQVAQALQRRRRRRPGCLGVDTATLEETDRLSLSLPEQLFAGTDGWLTGSAAVKEHVRFLFFNLFLGDERHVPVREAVPGAGGVMRGQNLLAKMGISSS